MAVETELKLRIDSGQLPGLKRHKLLKSLAASRTITRRLQNIYYDTPKHDLRESGMALRLRHAGGQWLQTLKGGGAVLGGLHRRDEWEVPVARAALDFSATPAVQWDELLRPSLRKKLKPVFVTDFTRSTRMLEFQGALIELCIDQGEVRTEQHNAPIFELELELKSGEPQKLFELAQALLESVPFELESVSKAEQGYRLLTGYAEHPVRGVAPVLAVTDTLAEALNKLAWSCMQHFQDNLHGAMASDDDEYLHQMRVALRRLRVVLRMAERMRADRRLDRLYKDVSELCIALGRIREWDVFSAQTLQPMCARMPGHAGLQALLAASERKRAGWYAALRDQAQARERQHLLLRFAIWMNGDYWRQSAGDAQPARDFATGRLRKLAKRFARFGQQLESADAARLHALRIVAKKLRYSAEFFSTLYNQRAAGAFLAALSKVQDVLGQINDIAVAHHLLDDLAADAAMAGHQEAVVLARGWIAHELSGLVAALRKCMRAFKQKPEFWEK